MSIAKHTSENLIEVKAMVEFLSDEQYNSALEVLSGSSVGQHIRHILEIYAEVIKSDRHICYDNRNRNKDIERNRSMAIELIDELQLLLPSLIEDRQIKMKANYAISSSPVLTFESSLFRELAYALEHSVHHQAIIKIGLKQIVGSSQLMNGFGVSAATRRNNPVGEFAPEIKVRNDYP